jgi:UDPglucose 6-dehydrogenase
MKISIVGSGHVGLVSGACFADLGNKVICMDNDKQKIALLKKGIMPFFEPGLKEMVANNVKEARLAFTSDLKEAVKKSEVIFIAVGTPTKENGEPDLSFVENVCRQIAKCMNGYKLIVEKSTVPVETGLWVERTVRLNARKNIKFDVASNPEFLREGSAIYDFLKPDRIIIGAESKKAREILIELYRPLKARVLITDIKSAEIIKHASNSFLAMKISFINAVSQVCDLAGADVLNVADGMGLDKRIGRSFLDAGCGYGGFCFPKDVDAFIHIAQKLGYDFEILKAVRQINQMQKQTVMRKVKDALWILKDKTIAVLGLSFKPDTDDMRYAPAIEIINSLQDEQAKIKVYDPQAMPLARKILKNCAFCKNAYEAAKGSDCLLIVTEWNEFKELDLKRIKKLLRQPVIVDGRNIYEPAKVKGLGFRYIGMGRPEKNKS